MCFSSFFLIKVNKKCKTINVFFIKVLHGSAAFKNGQFQVNDRLIAIERENLLKYRLNGEALKAFTTSLSQMSSLARSVKLVFCCFLF